MMQIPQIAKIFFMSFIIPVQIIIMNKFWDAMQIHIWGSTEITSRGVAEFLLDSYLEFLNKGNVSAISNVIRDEAIDISPVSFTSNEFIKNSNTFYFCLGLDLGP